MATVDISRDPFARTTLVRRLIEAKPDGCAWCGNLNGYGKLFQYGIEPDSISGRVNWIGAAVCSKSCLISVTT